ncbi:MAG: hypothetical protein ABSD21_03425 [Rhizomicrobium sp.]|jgi:hypothetical protein
MSNPPSFTKNFWTRGWPLDKAAYSIAPRELLDQLEVPYPKVKPVAAIEFPDDSGWLLRTLVTTTVVSTALEPIFEHRRGLVAVRDEIRDNLLVCIESGQFIAIGYVLPRKHDDLPVEIPIDLWEGEIDWKDSAVSGHGLDYSAVRIIPANWLIKSQEIIAPLQIAPPPAISPELTRKSPGRPSMVKFIKLAYEELKKSGKIDFQEIQIIAVRQVRETVKAMFPDNVDDGRGLGDEAIRRVIFEDYQREHDALKISSKL